MTKIGYGLVAALLLAACGGVQPGQPRGTHPGALRAQGGGLLSEAFGERSYKLFVPKAIKPGTPAALVVMLHGCTQDPDQFARGTRMNALAEKEGFYVLYPDQPRTAHAFKCWNWFAPGHQARGKGEPAAIVGMVEQVAKQHAVDRGAVFTAGISAGGAMAAVLGATYPDVFAAVGVASGLEYGAASSEMEGRQAMSAGGPDPDTAGRKAYEAAGGHARVVPAIVFHGADDRVVAPVNADQAVGQWAQTNDLAADGQDDDDLDARPDGKQEAQAPNGKRYTRWFFKDAQGRVVLEKVVVAGMGHAWSGGDATGSYTDPKGPDASAMAWEFFKANRRTARKQG